MKQASRNIGGVLKGPSAYFMTSPPEQYPDDVAKRMVEEFIMKSPSKLRTSA